MTRVVVGVVAVEVAVAVAGRAREEGVVVGVVAAGVAAAAQAGGVFPPTHSCGAIQSFGMGSIDTGSGIQSGGQKLHLVAKLASL